MKITIAILLLILSNSALLAQGEVLNQLDANGKKNGKCIVWLDANMQSISDKTKAKYSRYSYFEHGKNIWSMGGVDKDWKMETEGSKNEKSGDVKLLDGEYKWFDKSGKLKAIHTFNNGMPLVLRYYWSGTSNECWDYTRKWKGQPCTYFASIRDKKGITKYYYFLKFKKYENWYLLQEKDSTRSFVIDTIKVIGDSTFILSKCYMNGKLNSQSEEIFLSPSKGDAQLFFEPILHGHCIEWYLNGQKESEGDGYYGKKIGKWKYWDNTGKEIIKNE